MYNEPITIHYHGRLDPQLFERAFHEFLRRHEILRTTFASIEGQVVQAVHSTLRIEIPLADLTGMPEAERHAEAKRMATLDAQRPFDLAVGPLLRGRLFKLRDDEYRFHLALHHLIFDGVSIYRTVLPELSAIYNAFAKGEPSPLPDPPLQYGDYALWQDRLVKSPAVAEEVKYWREQLAVGADGGLPILQLPFDHARPPVPSQRGAMEKFALSVELSEAVKARSKSEGVTHYMYLLASFKALLHRYSGQEDLLVGGVTDGRRRPEFHNLVGYFLNSMVLRTRPQSSMTFRKFLADVKETVTGALANGDVPLDQLIRELQPKRDSSRHPFYQVLFSIEPPATPVELPWELTQMDIATGASKVDLYLEIDESPDGLIARFIYNTDVFERTTILRMQGHWLSVLTAAVADPTLRLQDLPMLTAGESAWLRDASSGPAMELPPTTIHGLFESQAQRTPNAIAVECRGERLTYAELDASANRVARKLCAAGVGPETLVGLSVDRSCHMATALMAILKAGGAYVPIDPALPKERIALLMESSQVSVMLTERALAPEFSTTDVRVLLLDDSNDDSDDESRDAALPPVKPENLAYVIHTSGSTGKPKGVEISHSAVVNLLLSMQREPGFAASDRLLAVTTLSFDIAGLEMYLPLISGGTVIIASKEDARDPVLLMDRMRESRPTVMQATPATWRALIDADWRGDSKLKILCGGEALPRDLVQNLQPRCGELWNMYGPTETTIWSTVKKISAPDEIISIGRPIANTDVFVLDAHHNLLPIGVTGELYIGGAGVARGYLRQSELTYERFIASPINPAKRLYRTGDLARWQPDGTLECLGRVDNQVKIRGFRVETEEIECALKVLPGVTGAAVKAWPDASGSLTLVAYVSGRENLELRGALQHKLPEYMMPSRIVWLNALPLTPNGKLDRNALPHPGATESQVEFVEPRNETERALVEIFASVLQIDRVSVTEGFFELGGNSLLVTKLLRRIELKFGKRLSMTSVFQSPSIAELAPFLEDKTTSGQARNSGVRARVVNIQVRSDRPSLFWIRGGPYLQTLQVRVASQLISVALDPHEEANVCQTTTVPQLAACIVRRISPHSPLARTSSREGARPASLPWKQRSN